MNAKTEWFRFNFKTPNLTSLKTVCYDDWNLVSSFRKVWNS